jgi:hypothetical protein
MTSRGHDKSRSWKDEALTGVEGQEDNAASDSVHKKCATDRCNLSVIDHVDPRKNHLFEG